MQGRKPVPTFAGCCAGDGGDAAEPDIARRARVGLRTPCDGVHRYNVEWPDGLKDRPRRGRATKPDEDTGAEVRIRLEDDPEPGEPPWTPGRIKTGMEQSFQIVLSLERVRRLVRSLDGPSRPDGTFRRSSGAGTRS